ncbi:ctr copper transporter [Colletotrichum scovillei]|uniref:ctr copper transporter n=1 Tax=Colletotrichum scovillei TaxID=1209932 RepID=UPI0015C2DF27|nr:ctr copper transporter [Colletotrichum scovillei]KAF4779422.1 ctr copper transporter [Colletotrichum scovillei]
MDSFLMARHGGDDHGATGTATASDAMPGMDMGSGTMNDTHGSTGSSISMMMMTIFQTSLKTPLYTEAWTPNSVGTYAATCIFLIFLAFGLRSMLALKSIQEKRWLDKDFKRRYVSVTASSAWQERCQRTAWQSKWYFPRTASRRMSLSFRRVMAFGGPGDSPLILFVL